MSSFGIGCIGIILLIVAILFKVPIGMSMILIGFVGFGAISGFDAAFGILRGVPYETFVGQTYAVVCLFLLMGNFAFKSGLSNDLFAAIQKWFGRVRGGLAYASILACGVFASICGSSVACAATMGVVALPEMQRAKYSNALATAALAAGGTLGILIPPSTVMILYGILTEQSIGKMFMAGFVPGFIQIILYICVIRIWAAFKPNDVSAGEPCSVKEKVVALKKTWGILFLFGLVIGGLYFGVFSPNEAAGIGAFGALLLGIARTKSGRKAFLTECLSSSLVTSGMCFMIVLGAMIFGYFLTVSRIPFELSTYITSIVQSPGLVLVGILGVMIILGCFMDSMAIVLLTIPVFYPLIQAYDINPIWFGILVVRVTEIGLITPPVGLNLFVINGVSGVPMSSIFKGITPFLIADIVHVAILILFPSLVLWLPGKMM